MGAESYYVSTERGRMDILFIHGFLSNSYWAKNIPIAILKKALENSLCFGVFIKEGAQVGFARVITDFATFGYIADVFVDEDHRKRGLGKKLVESITNHPDLKELRSLVLTTEDAHGLYRQFGFKDADNYMKLKRIK